MQLQKITSESDIEKPSSQQPIPKHAKKVFSGVIFDTYQWEQELFDGSTATFEKVSRPDTVIVFPIMPDGSIVLTEQEQPGKDPFIGGAGGMVDEGEGILAAAKRELLEETGLESDSWYLIKSIQPIGKIKWSVYIFVAKNCRQESQQKLDAGERIALREVNFEEFTEITLQDNFSEYEIVHHIFQAKLDTKKMKQLRTIFSPDNQ